MLRQVKFTTGDISIVLLIRERPLTFPSRTLREGQTGCLRLGDWNLLTEHSNKDSSQKERKVDFGKVS